MKKSTPESRSRDRARIADQLAANNGGSEPPLYGNVLIGTPDHDPEPAPAKKPEPYPYKVPCRSCPRCGLNILIPYLWYFEQKRSADEEGGLWICLSCDARAKVYGKRVVMVWDDTGMFSDDSLADFMKKL
jgi:hypothetical protein